MQIEKKVLIPTPEYEPTGYAWLVVGLLFVVAVLNYLDRLMISTMVDPIRHEFTIDNRSIGLLTSVFLWIYAVVSPFGGFLADRFSRTAVIVASLFFWSGATCVSGFAHSYHQLLFARGLMGISEACYMPAALALIADYHRGRTRSLATGLHMAGISTGAILGGLGGFLAEYAGWRFGFRVFGLLGVGFACLLLLALRDRGTPEIDVRATPQKPPADKEQSAENLPTIGTRTDVILRYSEGSGQLPSMRRSFGVPQDDGFQKSGGYSKTDLKPKLRTILITLAASIPFRVLFVVNVLIGSMNWIIYTWLPTYLKERFHLGLGASGLSATFYLHAAAFVGVLLAGVWADRWTRTNRRARSLVPVICFCIAGPALMATGSTGFLTVAMAGLVVVGLGKGSFDANHMPILRELVDQRYSATAFGVLNLISTAAGGAMVYAAGALKDAHVNLSLVFQGCGVAMLVAGFLLLYVGATGESRGSPAP